MPIENSRTSQHLDNDMVPWTNPIAMPRRRDMPIEQSIESLQSHSIQTFYALRKRIAMSDGDEFPFVSRRSYIYEVPAGLLFLLLSN